MYNFTAYLADKNTTDKNSGMSSNSGHSGSNIIRGESIPKNSNDDILLQSLRRSRDRRSSADAGGAPARSMINNEDHSHGGLYHQHHELLHQQQHQRRDDEPKLEEDHGRGINMVSREERLNQAIRELQKYQADAEGRQQDYQDELKAQLEEELRHMA